MQVKRTQGDRPLEKFLRRAQEGKPSTRRLEKTLASLGLSALADQSVVEQLHLGADTLADVPLVFDSRGDWNGHGHPALSAIAVTFPRPLVASVAVQAPSHGVFQERVLHFFPVLDALAECCLLLTVDAVGCEGDLVARHGRWDSLPSVG